MLTRITVSTTSTVVRKRLIRHTLSGMTYCAYERESLHRRDLGDAIVLPSPVSRKHQLRYRWVGSANFFWFLTALVCVTVMWARINGSFLGVFFRWVGREGSVIFWCPTLERSGEDQGSFVLIFERRGRILEHWSLIDNTSFDQRVVMQQRIIKNSTKKFIPFYIKFSDFYLTMWPTRKGPLNDRFRHKEFVPRVSEWDSLQLLIFSGLPESNYKFLITVC